MLFMAHMAFEKVKCYKLALMVIDRLEGDLKEQAERSRKYMEERLDQSKPIVSDDVTKTTPAKDLLQKALNLMKEEKYKEAETVF